MLVDDRRGRSSVETFLLTVGVYVACQLVVGVAYEHVGGENELVTAPFALVLTFVVLVVFYMWEDGYL